MFLGGSLPYLDILSGYGEEQVISKDIKGHAFAGRRLQTWNLGFSNRVILLDRRYAIG